MSPHRLEFERTTESGAAEAPAQAAVEDAAAACSAASIPFLRQLESELSDLRARVAQIEMKTTSPAPEAPAAALMISSPSAALERKVEELQTLLLERQIEIERFRRNSPDAALRAIEEQRDQARQDAANARADLAIQAAEIETKDALITALEQALEQQHMSLRSLEERFAEYAARLQEIRFGRQMPQQPAAGAPFLDDDGEHSQQPSSSPGLVALFRQAFSRPSRATLSDSLNGDPAHHTTQDAAR